uniref:Uncharacterized protein n=1 Tax=viral metagenome TaxID=1070528 RepID=A0A6M3KAU3_9ZZZZ
MKKGMNYRKVSLSTLNIQDPYRYLSLAVFNQAFADRAFLWLKGGKTMPLFRDTADIDPDVLEDTIKKYQTKEEE